MRIATVEDTFDLDAAAELIASPDVSAASVGSPVWLLLSLAIPLLMIPLLLLLGRNDDGASRKRDAGSLIGAGLTLVCLVGLLRQFNRGESLQFELLDWVPGMSIGFHVEPLGMLFAMVAGALWLPTTVYAIGYMRGHHEHHQTRFFACFPAAIFAALSAAFAANLLTLFIAYEVMTLSTYPLVAHHGTANSRRGARTYAGILFATSIGLLLMAVAMTGSIAGDYEFVDGGLLTPAYRSGELTDGGVWLLAALFGFGIGKAALMPFHRWLPAAMVAPTPVSALLHAVAVVKVGVFSVLKICVYVIGLETLRDSGAGVAMATVAGFTILAASIVAMRQDNLKRRLAYSTVSQLAYITLGAFLATHSSVVGAGMHIVMHAVGKITLFFCAGAILVASHRTDISQMRGLGRSMPWTFAAFAVATVSIIGIPPGGGSWSKWFLAVGTVQSGAYWLTAVLMISSLLNIAYLVPIALTGFMRPEGDEADHPSGGEAPMMCVVPLCLTAFASVVLFFAADPIYRLLDSFVRVSG